MASPKETQDKSKPLSNDKEPPELPFITTSDVVRELNKNLENLSSPDDGLEGKFELQRRLPDGSAIPASEGDVAYSDLQTKLQQSAAFVSQLKDEDKARWAEQQRLTGNSYVQHGDYKAAMDIYLTCLVVKQDSSEFVWKTFVPVLNNLAQCTLQLGMHRKTVEFCVLALEEIAKHEDCEMSEPTAVCKLYFKRAKAQRLKGNYVEAREDLHHAVTCLGKNESGEVEKDEKEPYRQAIQKELRHLQNAETEARRNRQKQKQAMKKVLSQTKSHPDTKRTTTDENMPESTGIFNEAGLSSSSNPRRRQYSTLRERKQQQPSATKSSSLEAEQRPELTYWQYYLQMVGRVAEALLVLLDDEETKQKLQQRAD